jgi:hypothetical protein
LVLFAPKEFGRLGAALFCDQKKSDYRLRGGHRAHDGYIAGITVDIERSRRPVAGYMLFGSPS